MSERVRYAAALAAKNSEALSFIPLPKLEEYDRRGQLLLEMENDEACGFLVYGAGFPVGRGCAGAGMSELGKLPLHSPIDFARLERYLNFREQGYAREDALKLALGIPLPRMCPHADEPGPFCCRCGARIEAAR
jgi:hypothetical protein